MYTVLDKDTIEMEIVPLIPKTKRGFPPTVPLVEIVNAILYKLKTVVQWHQLPVKALFGQHPLTWNAVYYHYRKFRGCSLLWTERYFVISFTPRFLLKSLFDMNWLQGVLTKTTNGVDLKRPKRFG